MADPKAEGALRDATTALADLTRRWRAAEDYLKIPALRAKHEVLTEQAADPNLWDDQDRARLVTTDLGRAGVALDEFDGLDPLHLFETEFHFVAQPQRGAV